MHILLNEIKALHGAILQIQKNGIMSSEDVVMLDAMTKKERSLITEYVLKNHVTSEGSPRLIKPPTGTIKGWSTHVEGKKRITAVTRDALIDKLFDLYSNGYLNQTFANMFEAALQDKSRFCSDNTILKYQQDYNRFIDDSLASMDVSRISPDYLCDYTVAMIKNNPIIKTAFRAYKSVLHLTFEYAIKKGFLDYDPSTRLKNLDFHRLCKPSDDSDDDEAMSPEQIAAIHQEIFRRMKMPKKYGICYTCGFIFRLSALTGMRAGELCSLKWSDIKNGEIHIHTQQLKNKRTGKYEYVFYTKNEKGISKGGRYFPVTHEIECLLLELKEAQRKAGIKSEWVFANKDGSWILADTCYEKFLHKICVKLGFTLTNNHAIRKYFNSYVLIPMGLSETNRAKLLGHSVEVNLHNYSFADHNYCQVAREALDSPLVTPGDTQNIIEFKTKKLRDAY